MDRTIQETFNTFYKAINDGKRLDRDVMSALILAQDFPGMSDVMHDIMDLFSKALHMQRITAEEWQHLIDGSEKINRKYNNRIEVARIQIAIINYLDSEGGKNE